ncbi:uncharacterized protein LOC107019406 [Solanum pennellii]|uniref:Uncharacterized protein LOC107019406 n=1 Tax=Solanum pennellii TaxID=28526 RepID=A0ABM1GSS0_SOLPN|nr:uncharacterized protein LOC107019406 [Solanum pennellii]
MSSEMKGGSPTDFELLTGSTIMLPRRANTRNVNAKNTNVSPPVPDQEVPNADFRNVIQMLAQSMTNQINRVHASVDANSGSAAAMVQGDKLREQPKDNKKDRTGNYDYSQQKSGDENCSQSQQKFSAPTSSSASVPLSKNRYDQKVRAPSSKSQGSVVGTKTYPTCPKCGKNHPSECLAGKERCFGCGQSGHRLKDCPSRKVQGGGNGRDQSKTSSAPASRPT